MTPQRAEYYRNKYADPANMKTAISSIAEVAANSWTVFFMRKKTEISEAPAVINKEGETVKNSLNDLNNHLFEQLERLNDDEICKDEQSIRLEVQRAAAVAGIATQIIETGRTQLTALKLSHEWNITGKDLPPLLEHKK